MTDFDSQGRAEPFWSRFRTARWRAAVVICVMAVALIEAWPVESRERLAVEVGERICRASANGAKLVYRPHSIDGVYVIPEYSAIRIIREGPQFREDCEVELRLGDLPPPYFSNGRADYVIILKSHGENRLAFRLRWDADWHETPLVRRISGGRFHLKIAPAHRL